MNDYDYYKGYKQALLDIQKVCWEYRNMWKLANDMPRMLEEERIIREIDVKLMSFPLNEVKVDK